MSEEKLVVEVIEPQHGFWEACVVVESEDENGRVKKVKEMHLVDAVNLQDCEKKIAEEMKGTMWEWKVQSCKQSKIQFVY